MISCDALSTLCLLFPVFFCFFCLSYNFLLHIPSYCLSGRATHSMFHLHFLTAVSLALLHTTYAAGKAEWRSRSIYQVLTDRFALANGSTTAPCDTGVGLYCGGSFKGIETQLDYIHGMGFDAIWISPITAQIPTFTPYGDPYHGYWQQDLYEINPHFGTADDLMDLSKALHARDMLLMVDVVVNHFGWNGAPSSVDYSDFNPFNEESYFHPYCAINYDDMDNTTNIQQCWMGDTTVSLPDLATEDADVASDLQKWIHGLISKYSIDGLRLDSALEVDTGFWSGFHEAAGVYMVGEVDDGDPGVVCPYLDYLPGVLNYAIYFDLVAAFESTSGSISNLANQINTVKSDCSDTSVLGSFSENHDQPRFAYLTEDMALAKNVVSYTMLADGIPIIYEGQEQHLNASGGSSTGGNEPYNREAIWPTGYNTNVPLYELIRKLNKARKHAISDDSSYLMYQNWPIYTDTSTLAVRKGNMVTVLSNKGADGDSYTQSIPAGYDSGVKVTELLTCKTLTADSSGNIIVPMAAGQPRIYYPSSSLTGSGLCESKHKRHVHRH